MPARRISIRRVEDVFIADAEISCWRRPRMEFHRGMRLAARRRNRPRTSSADASADAPVVRESVTDRSQTAAIDGITPILTVEDGSRCRRGRSARPQADVVDRCGQIATHSGVSRSGRRPPDGAHPEMSFIGSRIVSEIE